MKKEYTTAAPQDEIQAGSMDTLLAKLSEQQAILKKQNSALFPAPDVAKKTKEESSASSTLLTPASGSFGRFSPTSDAEDTVKVEAAEFARLKKELDAAKNQIARQKQELDQSRVIKHTFDQAIGPYSEKSHSPGINATDATKAFMTATRPFASVQAHFEDARSDGSEPTGSFPSVQNVWSSGNRPGFNAGLQPESTWGHPGPRPWSQRGTGNTLPPVMMPPPQQTVQSRNYSMPVSPVRGNGRGMNDFNQFTQGRAFGQSHTQNSRNSSIFQRGNGWDVYAGGPGPMDDMNLSGMTTSSVYPSLSIYPPAYQPQPIGTPLSPTAAEFRAGGQASANPWNNAVSRGSPDLPLSLMESLTLSQPPASPGQTYVSPMEPLNYRRLLDRSVTCNWKYIVDKIVCNNDQQASIFLQQKLKVGTVEQKYEIIEAIVAQAYPLMVNRFGNFLVQRCFEHGTPEQVVAIANAIRGNTLSLSMDAFGCHVVQKAFDAVPEDYKAIMVHELLRRIPETVIHRYACHVWQKLFELRWSDSPPQIMKYVNEALCGMWHEVALGETGSLVVQNIFENCLEEDKVCQGSFDYPERAIPHHHQCSDDQMLTCTST